MHRGKTKILSANSTSPELFCKVYKILPFHAISCQCNTENKAVQILTWTKYNPPPRTSCLIRKTKNSELKNKSGNTTKQDQY